MQYPSYYYTTPLPNQPYVVQPPRYVQPTQPQQVPLQYIQVPQTYQPQQILSPIYPQQPRPQQTAHKETEKPNIFAIIFFIFGIICPLLWIFNFFIFFRNSNIKTRQWAFASRNAFAFFVLFYVIYLCNCYLDRCYTIYDKAHKFCLKNSILDKCITSFDGKVRENTRKIRTHWCDEVNNIKDNSKITHIYIKLTKSNYHITDKEVKLAWKERNESIDCLNSLKSSIKISLRIPKIFTLEGFNLKQLCEMKNENITLLLKTDINTKVLVDSSNVELFTSEFNETRKMSFLNNNYLPTSLTINRLKSGVNDFTPLKCIDKVTINDHDIDKHSKIKLPSSTKKLNYLITDQKAIYDIQITNWSDLVSLKK
ncbi:hypothetical protein QTN25_004773 [Entamoeba marina]